MTTDQTDLDPGTGPSTAARVPASGPFDVGGIRLDRPFKIRRLGHFGYNCLETDAMLDFYVDGLGLIVSDQSPTMPARLPAEQREGLSPNERLLHFTRFGSDHHQFVLIAQPVWDWVGRDNGSAGASINQITWQVGSLAEVVEGADWIWGQGGRLLRSGRDMPGSNWHTYLFDPEGHINELYYGMEQVGWDGLSKPREMWSGVLGEAPALPMPSEAAEIRAAQGSGVDIAGGHRAVAAQAREYAVDGILMSRPFKVVGIGPVSLYVDDLDATVQFYSQMLGFSVRRLVDWNGHRGALLHTGSEHHSLALYETGLRSALGGPERADSMALGFRVANYRQLRAAVAFLTERGATEVEVPAELLAGFDYVTHLRDPDGNLVQLYYHQRQIVPSGPEPELISGGAAGWPELIDAPPGVYGGETFLGPWE